MIDRFKILKAEYRIHFKISLAVSLLICISLFLFFPRITHSPPPAAVYESILVTLNDFSQNTVQAEPANLKPREPKILIPDIVADPEILPDEIISSTENESSGNGINSNTVSGKGMSQDVPQLPFIPRQILEVLPQGIDENVRGYIEIKLKIGTDGKVIGYKIIENTTGSEKYLKNVIAAAYKSRWEPIKINNNKITYWVEKIYSLK